MAKKKSGLGRGLGALIPQAGAKTATVDVPQTGSGLMTRSSRSETVRQSGSGVAEINLSLIQTNPSQPRTIFGHQGMEELTESIRQHGILQPLALAPRPDGGYEVIAGERRLRAARLAGLKSVPAIIRPVEKDIEKFVLALIENIQREDLNPVEEARAYRRLTEEFGLTQENISKQVGKARSTVANTMRLLDLPSDMLDAVATGVVSAGNARALLAITEPKVQAKMFRKMLAGGVTVREAEASVQKTSTRLKKSSEMLAAEENLRSAYGTKVSVTNRKGKGKIVLHFFSEE
ncbi:ParB/RepB/Spo0J family partition protein, partial [Patescibacteria group bacterium]|nr:ParB/RepB/Spo0J family partition protein [Patescibacteria group bacterium]